MPAGHVICVEQQRAVQPAELSSGTLDASASTQLGWYYDDFSDARKGACGRDDLSRVAFTEGAEPPRGVTIRLDCSKNANQ